MKFRLLEGLHVQAGNDGKSKTFSRGDIVESKMDLAKRFGREKFDPVVYEAPPEAPPKGENPPKK